jgi:UDP-N-acetylmuramoyl-L-alanyl-D-glutamate--2,6-diaminopimelate ligase
VNPLEQLRAQGAVIERLSSDSRRCVAGTAFLAYPGERADGRAHIADALARGASGVLWDDERFAWRGEWRVPNAPVSALKQQAGAIAHEFYGRPSEALWTCGVTGTNGKTSCSQWIAALLGRAGMKCGVLGTLGSGFPGALDSASNTTPDALELHRILRRMKDAGAAAAAMEVSSHGLVQGRVNAVRFACALFTNLSHDHLDYHGTLEAYAEAKSRLFRMPGLQAAVLNLDDPLGAALAAKLQMRVIGYTQLGARGPREIISARPEGQKIAIDSPWGKATVAMNQVGTFNVSNALGVLGCLVARGIAFDDAAPMLASLPGVPGRMQVVAAEPLVVVDYAHTPDALEKVLDALRPAATARGGRLVAVFGAGGDRDPAKRPAMGAVAARLADRLVLTSDNPRSEDPLSILEQIAGGIGRDAIAAHALEPDRARAIRLALSAAAPGDVVLIAGKGHEDYQEIAGKRLPFSDESVVRQVLG